MLVEEVTLPRVTRWTRRVTPSAPRWKATRSRGPALTPAFSRIAEAPSAAVAVTSVVVPSAATWTVSAPTGISARDCERSAAIATLPAEGTASRTPLTEEAVDHAVVGAPSTLTRYSVAVRTTTVSPEETEDSGAGAMRSWSPVVIPPALMASPTVEKKPETRWAAPSTSMVTVRWEA